jgi:cytochrome P450
MDAVLPRGPRLPQALQSVWYGLAPLSFFDAARRRYGDVFTVRAMGVVWTVLADPAAVREVFTGDPDILYSGEANEALRPFIGTRNVLLLDGSEHLRRRKLLLPPFHGERMQACRAIMAQAARRELDAWPKGRPEPALRRMQTITFEVILRAVCGLGEADRLGPMATRLRAVLDWVQGPRAMLRFAAPMGSSRTARSSASSRRSTPTSPRRSRGVATIRTSRRARTSCPCCCSPATSRGGRWRTARFATSC